MSETPFVYRPDPTATLWALQQAIALLQHHESLLTADEALRQGGLSVQAEAVWAHVRAEVCALAPHLPHLALYAEREAMRQRMVGWMAQHLMAHPWQGLDQTPTTAIDEIADWLREAGLYLRDGTALDVIATILRQSGVNVTERSTGHHKTKCAAVTRKPAAGAE